MKIGLEGLEKELCRVLGIYLSRATVASALLIQKTKPSTREKNRIQAPWETDGKC